MIPEQPINALRTYASQSSYLTPITNDEIDKGVEPLDSLPADWWNWLWNNITVEEGHTVKFCNSLFAEVSTLLTAAGVTPSEVKTNDLLTAIQVLIQTVATVDKAGSLKSSLDSGKIAVSEDGTATVNDLGTPSQLTTGSKVIVAAVNELNTAITTLSGKLDDEVKRAKDAEAALQGSIDTHIADKTNPHGVTKAQVGLGNVTNVSTTSTITEDSTSNITSGAVYTKAKELQDAIDKKQAAITLPLAISQGGTGSVEGGMGLTNLIDACEDVTTPTDSQNFVISSGTPNKARKIAAPDLITWIKGKLQKMTSWITGSMLASGTYYEGITIYLPAHGGSAVVVVNIPSFPKSRNGFANAEDCFKAYYDANVEIFPASGTMYFETTGGVSRPIYYVVPSYTGGEYCMSVIFAPYYVSGEPISRIEIHPSSYGLTVYVYKEGDCSVL